MTTSINTDAQTANNLKELLHDNPQLLAKILLNGEYADVIRSHNSRLYHHGKKNGGNAKDIHTHINAHTSGYGHHNQESSETIGTAMDNTQNQGLPTQTGGGNGANPMGGGGNNPLTGMTKLFEQGAKTGEKAFGDLAKGFKPDKFLNSTFKNVKSLVKEIITSAKGGAHAGGELSDNQPGGNAELTKEHSGSHTGSDHNNSPHSVRSHDNNDTIHVTDPKITITPHTTDNISATPVTPTTLEATTTDNEPTLTQGSEEDSAANVQW